ncbi:hypothetical protein ACH4FX_38100 [Streptomyces sp. NPDC018019]|uniref:Rv1733c family protein n=1 Tax=Streptomyces sp. NPDC018019 TaxID=3365030 RepID=UPI0037926929
MALLLALSFLSGAPLSGLAASRAMEEAAVRERSQTYRVTGEVLDAPAVRADYLAQHVQVPVRWTARDGSVHTGLAPASRAQKAGTTMEIWANDAAELVPKPPSEHVSAVCAAFYGIGVAMGVGLLLLLAWWGARARFEQRRLAEWEREWARYGPRWSRGRT